MKYKTSARMLIDLLGMYRNGLHVSADGSAWHCQQVQLYEEAGNPTYGSLGQV